MTTQKQQLDNLIAAYDAHFGTGSAKTLVAAEKTPNGMTLKRAIEFLNAKVEAADEAAKPATVVAPPEISALPKPPAVPIPQATASLTMGNIRHLKLSPLERGRFQAGGGKVIPSTMKRSDFDKLTPAKKTEWCKQGGTLAD